MENAILVKVNKDGTGTMTYRIFMSEELTGMMQNIGGAMGQAGNSSAKVPNVDFFADIKASLEDQFSETATLRSSRQITNKKGWKGMEAIYSFTDIGQLKLGEKESQGMRNMGPQYAFSFTPGDTAVLTLSPIRTPEPAAKKEAKGTEDVESPTESGVEDLMGIMSSTMMSPMLKGMRVSILLMVNGEVVESNASYPSKKYPNVFTLADIAFDKVRNDPAGAKLLNSGREMDPRKLSTLGIDGVRLEDPTRAISISFK